MTVEPTPLQKTPWLWIVLGALGILCLCAIVICLATLAYFYPLRVSGSTPEVVTEFETAQPSPAPEQESTEVPFRYSAPAGSAVDIGSDMTLTVLDVTRPADDIIANGSALNTAAPEGEEFMQVNVEVTCNSDPGTQCTFYPTGMKAVLSDASTRDLQTFIEGVEDWDTAVEIEGGATEQGFLLFIVPKSESTIVVSYSETSSDQPMYLQLP